MMNWIAAAISRLAGFPPGRAKPIEVEAGIRIPMTDGVELVADRYLPKGPEGATVPVLLNRTPYGRKVEGLLARMLAQRGYQVLVVSCRGTFESGGDWEPLFNEARDGADVLKWLKAQPWFQGRLATFGGSYHGFTQWSVFGLESAPNVASVMQVHSRFSDIIRRGGAFGLDDVLTWVGSLEFNKLPIIWLMLKLRALRKKVLQAAGTVPLSQADAALVGRPVPFFQGWLANTGEDTAYWDRIDYGRDMSRVPPILLVAGWYDCFCKGQLEDFVKLRAAGRAVRLIVGPWRHGQFAGLLAYMRETLEWFDAHFRSRPITGAPVKLFDLGTRRWHALPDWPPAATRTKWYLHPEHRLSRTPASSGGADGYRFDPMNPTPMVGGIQLDQGASGPRDNRTVEARSDVLIYTTEPLDRDLAVVGPIHADLHARSSLDHLDLVVRLCDVQPNGRSINVADGHVRLSPGTIDRAAGGAFRVRVELTPTANTFRRGHRIRIQVASGAHPFYARNPGTGEPPATATRWLAADQQILHGPDHPSAIDLPLIHWPS